VERNRQQQHVRDQKRRLRDLLRNTRPLAWETRRGSSYGNGGHNRIAECLRLCP
jgi:hypothetical protein